MFSGIVDHVGQIKSITESGSGVRLEISTHFSALTLGESISVDGACLTVVEAHHESFVVELSPETLRLCTASTYLPGTAVNLERALCVGDRLGGHFVTGHIDQTVRLSSCQVFEDFVKMIFEGVLPSAMGYLHSKGCVALNGVSLTVNEVHANGFAVMLIPHTLERTTLSQVKLGERVNVEWDWMSKMVVEEVRRILPQLIPKENS